MFGEANRGLKIAIIGQAIVQAVGPRTIIAPLQLGLGVQAHHSFKSKFLVETLHKLGFSSSYPEVQKFRFCAASTVDEICLDPNQVTEDYSKRLLQRHNCSLQVVKFVADNIDHDTRTIDGKDTFHGMGMIAAFTPANGSNKTIVRRKAIIADVRAIGKINIPSYNKKAVGNGLTYEKLAESNYKDEFLHTKLLLKLTWSLRTSKSSWSGVMQLINDDPHAGTWVHKFSLNRNIE